jgi:hypothetical protein
VNAHYPAQPGYGIHQLAQLPLPPGKRGDVTGQRPRCRRHPAQHRAAPGDRLEFGPDQADQVQRVGQ